MSLKTIFFDLDGVLLDTEPLYSRFWREAAECSGFSMSLEESLSMRSLDAALAREKIKGLFGVDIYDPLREKRKELMEAYRETHPVHAKPGAAELIRSLDEKGAEYYIVTASPKGRVERYSADAGLTLPLDRMISTKSVGRGKPYPDVYLEALRIAGCEAGRAIAVEDSPNGIRSAHAAGLYTVMIPDLTEPTEEDLGYCDAVYGGLGEFALKEAAV
ncbi:MAG: HAD family phosphatase [Lachnospiraceae bacterium]|nr:HAD family phosphatase [Lachnospiraceae bacterium]